MGFFLGILIIGALLAAVFGRTVAQAFVLGTTGIVFAVIGVIAIVVIIGVIQMQYHPYNPPVSTRTYDTYSYMNQPAAASDATSTAGSGYAPATTSGYTPTTAATTSLIPPPANLPIIGIADGQAPNPQDSNYLVTYCHVPAGVGDYVGRVMPGSPAEAAGLHVGDILTSAEMYGSPCLYLSPAYSLSDFEKAHESAADPRSISLHVYRLAVNRDFYVLVTPR